MSVSNRAATVGLLAGIGALGVGVVVFAPKGQASASGSIKGCPSCQPVEPQPIGPQEVDTAWATARSCTSAGCTHPAPTVDACPDAPLCQSYYPLGNGTWQGGSTGHLGLY